MRDNSGSGQGTNNLRDPTLKEQERARGKSGEAVLDEDARKGDAAADTDQRTTQMGSHARKTGQKGAGAHR